MQRNADTEPLSNEACICIRDVETDMSPKGRKHLISFQLNLAFIVKASSLTAAWAGM